MMPNPRKFYPLSILFEDVTTIVNWFGGFRNRYITSPNPFQTIINNQYYFVKEILFQIV